MRKTCFKISWELYLLLWCELLPPILTDGLCWHNLLKHSDQTCWCLIAFTRQKRWCSTTPHHTLHHTSHQAAWSWSQLINIEFNKSLHQAKSAGFHFHLTRTINQPFHRKVLVCDNNSWLLWLPDCSLKQPLLHHNISRAVHIRRLN